MKYFQKTASPLGNILLAADEHGLTGLWFEGCRYYGVGLSPKSIEKDLPVFADTKTWLDIYFSGQIPVFTPALHLTGTAFRLSVWALLLEIPYGSTVSYGLLANQFPSAKGKGRMSAQAIGCAVGHNPVSLIVPCHRVIGANGALIGYGGGLERKQALLAHEGVILSA